MTREAEGQKGAEPPISSVGRNSLDVFSPARDEPRTQTTSAEMPFGRTHGTTVRQLQSDKASSSSLEGEVPTTPPTSQQTNHSQPAPPFFTPEPSIRRPNGFQAQLSYNSPAHGAPPTAAAGAALSAAASSTLSQDIAEVVGQGGAAPLTSLQIHFIQNMIHETLEDFRDACHRDVVNLQVEMVRQFYIQLNEIHGLIEKYSVNESLVEEVEKLREENRRLKTNY
ncbi:hypothetical protein F2P81_006662 [Scophthalmus maximus]|uniref:Uncharacterized protein n=1 Tax=Scophthalmus maximus TaxID=52904 RepID=A0A6A4TC58_SCOMX|nr:hypothetical protein F2P81_006662 [Scophthalmus maximus]